MQLSKTVDNYVSFLREQMYSPAHINSVRYRLARFLDDYGGRDVTAVSPDDVHNHFLALKSSGLASGTLAGYKSTHRAFWRWCVRRQLIDDDPSTILLAGESRKVHSYSYEPVNSRAAKRDDLQTVLQSLPAFVAHRHQAARDVRDAFMVSLVADSAGRRGEIWNIKRKALERALEEGEALGDGVTVYHVATHGKTGFVQLRFFDETAVFGRLWLTLIPSEALFVFVNLRTGERLRRDALVLGFNRICEFAGVPVFRFHAVRKRAVTDIIAQTGDPKVGQKLANHRSPRTTQIYYNVVEEDRVDAAAAAMAQQRRQTPPLIDAFFKKTGR